MAARPKTLVGLTGFPNRLNELIGENTYAMFEEKCGLKHGNIKGFLRGVEPSREKLESIITATGCSARWLITGKGEPFGDEKSPPAEAGEPSASVPFFLSLASVQEKLNAVLRSFPRYSPAELRTVIAVLDDTATALDGIPVKAADPSDVSTQDAANG